MNEMAETLLVQCFISLCAQNKASSDKRERERENKEYEERRNNYEKISLKFV